MRQQSALQAQSSGSVPQPHPHREMWARVKEFDGDDDKYEGMIERIAQGTDAPNLNNAVLSNVDKKYALEDGESETAVRDAVDELNKNPVAENFKLDMADTVTRGALLKGLAPIAEVQKHVMEDWARLNSYAHMRAEVVDLLRAEAALLMPMDVDGACMSGPKGQGNTKGKGKSDDTKGQGKAKDKGKKGEETRVCHKCNKPGHLREDCAVYKKRMAENMTRQPQFKERQLQCKAR